MSGLETTHDRLLGGRLLVKQYKKAYRIAIDPILLAASISPCPGQYVLDLGCGVGGASLCLAARIPGLHILGLEKEESFIHLALENIQINSFQDTIELIRHDLKAPLPFMKKFDWVMANPPYLKQRDHSPSPYPLRQAANSEGEASLSDWIKGASFAAKEGGSIAFIHRWDRGNELIKGFSPLGEMRIAPLIAKEGQEPHRAIFLVKNGVGRDVTILSPVTLHYSNGNYTPRIENVLRHAAALDLT